MGFVGVLLMFLQMIFGSLILAAVLAVVLLLFESVLPLPQKSLAWKYVAGIVYLLFLTFLLHFAWFSDYYACPSGRAPFDVECNIVSVFSSAGADAFKATVYCAPYLALFYSAAFFIYHRIGVRNKYLRALLSIWVFLLVMLIWLLVFPWTLEGYLSLFY